VQLKDFKINLIDKFSPIPRYVQLIQRVKEMIVNTPVAVGERLPPNNQLAKFFRVDPMTMHKALSCLKQEEIVTMERGSGTFVKAISSDSHFSKENIRQPKGTLLVLLSSNSLDSNRNPYNWFVFSDPLQGIISACGDNGYSYHLLFVTRSKSLNLTSILEKENLNKFSGIIFLHTHYLPTLSFKTISIPWTEIPAGTPKKNRNNFVCIDQASGIKEALGYLLKLGHRRIGHIASVSDDGDFPRLTVFHQFIKKNRLPFDKELEVLAEIGSETDGYNAMLKLLELNSPPTAIFSDTDIRAFGAINAIRAKGLCVPEDISVIGFDDIAEAADFSPSLTTIQYPRVEQGYRSATRLIESIEDGKPNLKPEFLSTKLIIRRSCSPLLDKNERR